jgi:replication-associated recombination protein RarA
MTETTDAARVTLPKDPWQAVTTVHGVPADEVISGLQKCLRRGLAEPALLIAYEMFLTSPELEQKLWDRLTVISVEDVGFGNVMAPVLVDTLYRNHIRFDRPSGDRFLFAAHAVRLLATSAKDRTSDDMVNWAKLEIERRNQAPAIPDFAIDMHTRRGWEMGRGYEHFMTEASRVENVSDAVDPTYRDRILAAIAAGELR